MKEFYEVNSINATKEDFEREGFTVINFNSVKQKYMEFIDNRELAHEFHLYHDLTDRDKKPHLAKIYDSFERIVFKESRGGGGKCCIGWETINSYLQYHSGIIYKWFK